MRALKRRIENSTTTSRCVADRPIEDSTVSSECTRPWISRLTSTFATEPTNRIAAGTSEGGPEGWTRIQGEFWREGPIAPDFVIDQVTPRFEEEAIAVIEGYARSKKEKPLFLYLALPSPHTPWVPTPEWQGKSQAGMYGDFVMQVDAVVGNVVAALDKANMSDNTLVFFSSDNGPVWYDKDEEKFDHVSTGPLKGMKGDSWEGGHRMPFIAKWPQGIEAGSVNDHLVSFADLLATFAELVDSKPIPEGSGEDSISFLSGMIGEKVPSSRRTIIHDTNTIRNGDWKLITQLGSGGFSPPRRIKPEPGSRLTGQLYNLREDIGETKNRFLEYPEIVERLKAKLEKELAR
jgi:arylsulfatase A